MENAFNLCQVDIKLSSTPIFQVSGEAQGASMEEKQAG